MRSWLTGATSAAAIACVLAVLPAQATHANATAETAAIEVQLDASDPETAEQPIELDNAEAPADVENLDLGEIEILGERSLLQRVDDTTAVTIINSSDFALAGSLGDALEQVPGLDVREQGGSGQLATVQIRGARANQVLVLMDGVPLQPGGAADLTLLPIGLVDRLEIIRGPEAARFGAGALGGVLNIITRRPSTGKRTDPASSGEPDSDPLPLKERLSQQLARSTADGSSSRSTLNLSSGSFGQARLELSHSAMDASYFIALNQARNNYDYLRANGESEIRRNNEAAQLDFWTAWHGGSTDWRMGISQMRRGVPGSAEFPTLQAGLRRSAAWLQAAQDDWCSSLTILDTRFFDPQPYLQQPAISTRDTQWQAQWACGLFAGQAADWGVKPRWDYIDSADYGAHSRIGLDVTRALESKLGSATAQLQLGLTASSDVGLDPLARVGLGWQSGPARIHLATGYAVRHPDFSELYLAGMGSVEGNPNLEPERAWSSEAGVELHWTDTSAELGAFLVNYDDSILFVPVSSYLVRATNTGRAEVGGLELMLNHQLNRHWSWNGTCTWLPLAEYTSGIPLTNRSKQHVNSHLTYSGRDWWGQLELDFTGRTPADLFGNLIIKPRTTCSLGLTRELSNGSLSLCIDNLFDEAGRDSWNYPLPGREFTVSWRIEL